MTNFSNRPLWSDRRQTLGVMAGVALLLIASGVIAEDRPAWQVHFERGKELAKRREWKAAIAEFSEAIRVEPGRSAPRIARGNARGELSLFAEARADFARAAELDPDDPEPRYRVALACIAEGDDDGYRRACGDLHDRYATTNDPRVASPLAYTCVARPGAGVAADALVRWGERAVPLFRGNERVLGATLYRAGRFEDAVRSLEASSHLTTLVAWDWLFLAMSHHRLGRTAQSRENLEKARRWMAAAEAGRASPAATGKTRTAWHSWNERAEVIALCREAETLVGDDRPVP
jgi:tetratricopeptide (TPR) repeat protein